MRAVASSRSEPNWWSTVACISRRIVSDAGSLRRGPRDQAREALDLEQLAVRGPGLDDAVGVEQDRDERGLVVIGQVKRRVGGATPGTCSTSNSTDPRVGIDLGLDSV